MSDLLLVAAPQPVTLGGRLGLLAPAGRQLLRALPLSLLALGVAIVGNFALPRLAPGDPIDFLIPAEQASLVSPEQREQLARQLRPRRLAVGAVHPLHRPPRRG